MPDVKMPDGNIVSFPDDMPISEIKSLISTKYPEAMPEEKKTGLAGVGQKVGDVWEGVKQGTTFGFGDEAQAAIAAGMVKGYGALTGDEYTPSYGEIYQQSLGELRNELGQARERSPYLTTGGEITGAVLSPVATAKALPQLARGVTGFAKAKPISAGLGLGAVQGGLYGAGTSEGGAGEVALGALQGAGTGAVAGGVIGGASRGLGYLTQKALNKHSRQAQQAISGQVVAPEAKGFKQVVNKLAQDFPDEQSLKGALKEYVEGNKTLAEIGGEAIESKAKGAAQYPSGGKVAVEYLGEKMAGSRDRLRENVANYVSETVDFSDAMQNVLEAGRKRAAPLYKLAEQAKITPTPEITRIITQTPSGKTAVKNANILAQEMGHEGIEKLPDGQALDLIKRSFDDLIEGYRDKTTGILNLDERGRAIQNNLSTYLSEVKRINPKYAEALKESGDYLSITDAMNKGADFTKKIDMDKFKKLYSGLSTAEKEAYKVGAAKSIRDMIDRTNVANPYNSIFKNDLIRKKLQIMYSPAEYNKLAENLNAEEKLIKLYQNVIGGSPTMSKAMAAGEISDRAAEEIATALATGNVGNLAQGGVVSLIRKSFDGLSDRTAKNVAEILFETDPTKKLAIAKAISVAKGLDKSERALVLRAASNLDDKVKNMRAAAIASASRGSVAAQSMPEATIRASEYKDTIGTVGE